MQNKRKLDLTLSLSEHLEAELRTKVHERELLYTKYELEALQVNIKNIISHLYHTHV